MTRWLITGAGTLGTALAREMLRVTNIGTVLMLDNSEDSLWRCQEALGTPAGVYYRLGDIRDRNCVDEAMKGIDRVIHTAALKHVLLTNDRPGECIRTNVQGTLNLIEAALEQGGVEEFVNISTDKACFPSNIYGETKRLTETLAEWGWSASANEIRFASIRPGNFLASRGSVVERWKEQIKQRPAIFLTERKMNRFFIKPDEVAAFIIDMMGRGRKEFGFGQVYIPKLKVINMGRMADAFARRYGCGIEITGARPGEKMNEMIANAEETTRMLDKPGYYVITHEMQNESPGIGMLSTEFLPCMTQGATEEYIKDVI